MNECMHDEGPTWIQIIEHPFISIENKAIQLLLINISKNHIIVNEEKTKKWLLNLGGRKGICDWKK
jgi:hypothetical protein